MSKKKFNTDDSLDDSNVSKLLKEMVSITNTSNAALIKEVTKSITNSFETIIKELKDSMTMKLDAIQYENFEYKNKVDKLELENINLKKENTDLQKIVQMNSEKIEKLVNRLNNNEQQQINDQLVVISSKEENFISSQLTESLNENNKITMQKKFKNKNNQIQYIYATNNSETKQKILQKKKQLKTNGIQIFESLIKPNQDLFSEAIKLAKDRIIHSTWTYKGTVHVRKSENSSPTKILNINDLKKILNS